MNMTNKEIAAEVRRKYFAGEYEVVEGLINFKIETLTLRCRDSMSGVMDMAYKYEKRQRFGGKSMAWPQAKRR